MSLLALRELYAICSLALGLCGCRREAPDLTLLKNILQKWELMVLLATEINISQATHLTVLNNQSLPFSPVSVPGGLAFPS